ncbi:MAG: protein translocase subunit SecD [Lachnospiraceae bacterium]|nr:protein translocase subunit SecD [Lachnospiraceae bacterium]
MKKKQKSIVLFLVSLVVLVLLALVLVFGVTIGGKEKGSARNIILGLDLKGGVSITYEAVGDYTEADMKDTLNKLKLRAEEFSAESDVYMEGDNRITVDIPGQSDADEVLEKLGKPGSLSFVTDYNTDSEKVWVEGSQVADAQPGVRTDEQTGKKEYIVNFEFNSEGAESFAEATSQNINNIIYIVYDGEVVSSPRVNEAITGGTGEISGMASYEEAEDLASMIRIGSLKVELKDITHKVVGARLGSDAVSTSLLAGILGVLVIIIFMTFMYRVPGVAAGIAMIFYVEASLICLNGFDLTLTLSGIAGVILSIGMAVDANIIINTRIKEEIASGKSIENAIDTGFKKASSAIVDGNVTTLIACVVLMVLTSGTIKGFAQTLAIGTILSIFTALVVSRFYVKVLYNMGMDKQGMYGVQKERKTLNIIQKRVISFVVVLAIIATGLVGLLVNKSGNIDGRNSALNYSVEFQGGINLTVNFDKKYSTDEFNKEILPAIKEITNDAEAVANEVVGSNEFSVKIKEVDDTVLNSLNEKLTSEYGATDFGYSTIGSTLSTEMRKNAVISVLVALVCMLIYIFVRFRDMKFAISAVITLACDVLIVFTFYSLSYTSVGNTFIACMLTILGYSINATIVIFDRVREHLKSEKNPELLELGNRSITQTMSRTIYTSLTSFITIFFLYILGVSSLKEFAAPLMVGIIGGMFTNMFIPCALWYMMNKKKVQAKA